jgi:hypothetical protein
LFCRAVVSGGEFLDSAFDVGLSPELGGTVVEQVEVVGVVALPLDDLELDVLIVQVVIEGRGSFSSDIANLSEM